MNLRSASPGRAELFDPLALHVKVSKRSHVMKKIAAAVLQFAPARGRIHLIECVGHGTATPERGAQIMNVVGVPIGRHLVRSFEHAFHPYIETRATRMSASGDVSWMCHGNPKRPRGPKWKDIL